MAVRRRCRSTMMIETTASTVEMRELLDEVVQKYKTGQNCRLLDGLNGSQAAVLILTSQLFIVIVVSLAILIPRVKTLIVVVIKPLHHLIFPLLRVPLLPLLDHLIV